MIVLVPDNNNRPERHSQEFPISTLSLRTSIHRSPSRVNLKSLWPRLGGSPQRLFGQDTPAWRDAGQFFNPLTISPH